MTPEHQKLIDRWVQVLIDAGLPEIQAKEIAVEEAKANLKFKGERQEERAS